MRHPVTQRMQQHQPTRAGPPTLAPKQPAATELRLAAMTPVSLARSELCPRSLHLARLVLVSSVQQLLHWRQLLQQPLPQLPQLLQKLGHPRSLRRSGKRLRCNDSPSTDHATPAEPAPHRRHSSFVQQPGLMVVHLNASISSLPWAHLQYDQRCHAGRRRLTHPVQLRQRANPAALQRKPLARHSGRGQPPSQAEGLLDQQALELGVPRVEAEQLQVPRPRKQQLLLYQ